VLTLEGVTKRFGGLTAVRAVSMDVREHELVGIIGPNGAGKATLPKTAFGPPTARDSQRRS